jgi:hypothetical protein
MSYNNKNCSASGCAFRTVPDGCLPNLQGMPHVRARTNTWRRATGRVGPAGIVAVTNSKNASTYSKLASPQILDELEARTARRCISALSPVTFQPPGPNSFLPCTHFVELHMKCLLWWAVHMCSRFGADTPSSIFRELRC